MASPAIVADQAWYTDSRANNHIILTMNNCSIKANCEGKDKLVVGNGTKLFIARIITKMLHVLSITKNLISISQFTSDRLSRKVLLQGILRDRLYQFDLSHSLINFKNYQAQPVVFVSNTMFLCNS